MNIIHQGTSPLKMTSREIAALTGKEHFHVKRDIENMLIDLGEDASNFGCIYLDSMNRQQNEYHLDREHTECLITGYSAVLRMKVIKRIRELEGAGHSLPTLPEALRLAADLAEQTIHQQALLAEAAPKAEFVDRFVNSSGSIGFREAAKLLSVKETHLRRFLIDEGVMYVLAHKLTPYASHIDAGRFTVRTGENMTNGHAFTQAKFTPKGIQWLAKKLVEAGMLGGENAGAE